MPYHNLLAVTRNDGTPAQTIYWDGNTAAMEEAGELHYYLQDELGIPLRVSGRADGKDTARSCRTYGYDEFGNDLSGTIGKELEETGIPNPYTAQGEGQPFGYTGYRYDRTSGIYFAQAREYRPETGRFHAQDVVAGNGAEPVTLNRYTYCTNSPINYFDPLGLEKIVISGGIYRQTKFDNGDYCYEFIDAGLAQISEWKEENTDEKVTWVIADNGWSELNKSEFEKCANDRDVNLVFIENKEQLIDYLEGNTEIDNSVIRSEDKISSMSIFSHGLSKNNGIISLGYNYNIEYNIELDIGIDDLKDIKDIKDDIFTDDIVSYIYSCNSGTAGDDSIGQKWANLTGGKTYAYYGKTDYSGCSDKSYRAKIARKLCSWIYKVNAFGGKTSLPTEGNDAYQVEFCPQ